MTKAWKMKCKTSLTIAHKAVRTLKLSHAQMMPYDLRPLHHRRDAAPAPVLAVPTLTAQSNRRSNPNRSRSRRRNAASDSSSIDARIACESRNSRTPDDDDDTRSTASSAPSPPTPPCPPAAPFAGAVAATVSAVANNAVARNAGDAVVTCVVLAGAAVSVWPQIVYRF